MLPSTGYFNGINCPFYDNGLCDRPYCHYRHVKKDFQTTTNEGIESGAILQKLVSAAVQKVLQQTEASGPLTSTQPSAANNVTDAPNSNPVSTSKAIYNPTPISELNKFNNTDVENIEDVNEQRKRHIPVPYTPRKPASIPIKRPVDTNGSSKPFVYNPPPLKYTPGSVENSLNDTYTPSGAIESKEKYLPGSEKELQKYMPDVTAQESPNKRNYVPSTDRATSKKKVLEYKPTKVSTKSIKPSVTYQPTPRSLAPCFSSDEDVEPETKKRKLSHDLNGLDDLGPEFDILDQILDEENPGEAATNKVTPEVKEINMDKQDDKSIPTQSHQTSIDSTHKNGDASKSEKRHSERSHKSNHKSKSDKKEKLIPEGKDKKADKHKKSSHQSSTKENERDYKNSKVKEQKDGKEKEHKDSRDKEKERKESKNKQKECKDNKDRHSSDKKKDSSKSSHHSSISSKYSSSKKSEKSSNSKSSKSDSRSKKKRDKGHKSSKESKEKRKSKEPPKNDFSDDHFDAEENNLDDEEFELSDPDEDAIALECKRIFEEYVPTEKPNCSEEILKTDDAADKEYIPVKKRVSRTIDKNIKVIPKAPVKPDFKVGAAQTMAERLVKVREFHSSRNTVPAISTENVLSAMKTHNAIPELNKNTANPPGSKIRIAHVPYASTLLNAKKTMPPAQYTKTVQPSTSSTISQTVKKGVQRVAHIPNEKFIDRPGVLEPLASKIAANIRSIYLNMMIDESLKLYVSPIDAYARAQHEELATSKKCSTVQIYKNSAVLTVNRLRKELLECNGVKKSGNDSASGKTSNSGSWSIESKNKKNNDSSQEFTGAKFYKNMNKWVLTEEQLQENGFPRPHANKKKGRAIIYGQNKQSPPKGYMRMCCRCKKDYTVDKRGFPVVKEECIYHPNRKYKVRGEAKYQCCSQDASSDGCCIAPTHVYEYVDFENLNGFVRTLPPEREMDDYGVYSLDCEMCYTTQGLDLTRVTVINSSCKVVFETLIKPLHPIIDYNTRYSGITEEQMADVKTTLLDVQATLLAMFNSKTILVGHSLESDFKALKLIHDTVVDTSVLFPHKMGPPFKRALRNLSSEYLKKIIQNSVDGHDSAEDAMVCMELLHYKLREDLKTR